MISAGRNRCRPSPRAASHEIRTASGELFAGDVVDVGKHLRPNWRGGRMVLFVDAAADSASSWQAMKVK